ncbi:hypothetical protein Tco_1166073 [Tanacetum coccineum]
MKEEKAKEKGVAFKYVEDSSRPARSILTLKPLPIINPKDKGKGVLQEPEPIKKMAKSDFDAAQIARDAKISRQLEVDWQAEEERKSKEDGEREEYIIEERAKFLAEIIAAQRKFKAAQRSVEIKKEKLIKKMNEKATGEDTSNKENVLKEPVSTKVEVKQEGNTESTRKRPVHDEEGEINYEVLNRRSDGSSRWIKSFSEMVTRFDRMDLEELYNLVMQRFETTTPEGVDLVLLGDLRIMFEETADDDLWKNQEKWILKSWNFYENCGVHILVLEDGTKFHMLAERRYPLTKETLKRMLALRLIAKSASVGAYNLLRFIQK